MPIKDVEENEKEKFYKLLICKNSPRKKRDSTLLVRVTGMVTWKRKSRNTNVGPKQQNAARLHAYEDNMKIARTFFDKRDERKWTWISSPYRLVKNEIHYLLINDGKIAKDATVLSKFEFPSHHRMCRAIIGIPRR
mgnify:CR=1 FL=1